MAINQQYITYETSMNHVLEQKNLVRASFIHNNEKIKNKIVV